MAAAIDGVRLSREFTECAARFRRIACRTESDVSRELQSGAAVAAKCLKRAAEAGMINLGEFLPWPEPIADSIIQPDLIEMEWGTRWTAFALVVDRSGFDHLPANLWGMRTLHAEKDGASFIVDSSSSRTRAENSAAVCDWLAGLCESDATPAPLVEPNEVEQSWPPDDGWHFDHPGYIAFRGVVGTASGIEWKLIEYFATTKKPAKRSTLIDKFWIDENGDSRFITPAAVDQKLKAARSVLREMFHLTAEANPIPSRDHGDNAAWEIDESVLVKNGPSHVPEKKSPKRKKLAARTVKRQR